MTPTALPDWAGHYEAQMAGHASQTEPDPCPLVEVFRAAWVVVGRRAYALPSVEQEQLRCDLASCIGRLFLSGVDDPAELLRRSILRFLH